jgi:hypothetical protein
MGSVYCPGQRMMLNLKISCVVGGALLKGTLAHRRNPLDLDQELVREPTGEARDSHRGPGRSYPPTVSHRISPDHGHPHPSYIPDAASKYVLYTSLNPV